MGNREDKSLHHASCMAAKCLDLNKPWFYKYGRKKNEKIDLYEFPGHDCTQEQNGSPY